MFVAGLLFGLWYIMTMWNLTYRVKERSMLDGGRRLPPPPPMVPSILNTFNNQAFVTLLPAWVCDSLVNAIIQSLLTFFVRYVGLLGCWAVGVRKTMLLPPCCVWMCVWGGV